MRFRRPKNPSEIHHNQTLILWNDWIGCLLRNHDFYRGISELKKLLAVRKKVNGLDSPQTLETWYAYAYYLYATKQFPEAARELPDILARFEQLYGTLDEETTTVRLTYAQTLYATRHLVGACDEYHRVIAAYQQQSHQDPMKFLVVRSEYSRCLLELGRFEETLTELSTIVEQAGRFMVMMMKKHSRPGITMHGAFIRRV